MPSLLIIFRCNKSRCCILCLAISLIERTAHNNFHKLKNLFSDWSTPCNHISDSPSEIGFSFWKNNLIIHSWLVFTIFMKFLAFRLDTTIEKTSFHPSCFRYFSLNCLLNSVIDSWDCDKNCWPHKGTVILNFSHITVEKSNINEKLHWRCSIVDNPCLHYPFKDMGQRQKREIYIIFP